MKGVMRNEGWWCLDALRLLGNALVTPTTSDDGEPVCSRWCLLVKAPGPGEGDPAELVR